MFDGVGRHRDRNGEPLVVIGDHSLNGYERACLFRNNGDGTFTDVAYPNAADRIEDGRGIAVFDFDVDGRQDLLIRNSRQRAELLRNAGPTGHWLQIELEGVHSNADAIGTQVIVHAGGRLQVREVHAGSGYLSSSSLVQHFGLGPTTLVEKVIVRWPSGCESVVEDVPADRRIAIRETTVELQPGHDA